MPYFKIYAGIDNAFGKADYHGTYNYKNKEEALRDACRIAKEECYPQTKDKIIYYVKSAFGPEDTDFS